MAATAILSNLFTLPILIESGLDTETIVDMSLDLLTVAVPPAIPAAMSCGIVFAIERLKRYQIYCISPPRVNLTGQITTFVFDKTGTLTEDSLTVKGARPITYSHDQSIDRPAFTDFIDNSSTLTTSFDNDSAPIQNNYEAELRFQLAEAMASCTGVTYVESELVGDPLDVQMF